MNYKVHENNKAELIQSFDDWKYTSLAILDLEEKLKMQRDAVTQSEANLKVLKGKVPENIYKEYEAMQIIWKLKGSENKEQGLA